MLSGEFGALLLIESVPVALPEALGSKFTVYCAFWLGARVSAAAEPLKLNPVPETVTVEIFASAFPLLVTVTDSVNALPTFTLPKLKLVALGVNAIVEATPFPLRGMEDVAVEALLSIVIAPESVAAPVGLNSAVNVALLPAASV